MAKHFTRFKYICKNCGDIQICHSCYTSCHFNHEVELIETGQPLNCQECSESKKVDMFMQMEDQLNSSEKKFDFDPKKSIFDDLKFPPKLDSSVVNTHGQFDILHRGKILSNQTRLRVNFDNKSETFQVVEPIYLGKNTNILQDETFVCKVSLKIICGGLDDKISFGLTGPLKTNKFSEVVPGIYKNSFGYSADTGKMNINIYFNKLSKQFPRSGSGDILTYCITNHSNVRNQ